MPAPKKRTPEEEAALEAQFIGETSAPDAGEPESEYEGEVIFRSKGRGFRAIRIPRNRWFAPNGEAQTTPGETYEFEPNGEFRTDDPVAIAHLRGLQSFNREFWEVGKEPGRIPSSESRLEEVAEAGVTLNLERLDELEELERATHKREDVLIAIRATKRKVGQLRSAEASA